MRTIGWTPEHTATQQRAQSSLVEFIHQQDADPCFWCWGQRVLWHRIGGQSIPVVCHMCREVEE